MLYQLIQEGSHFTDQIVATYPIKMLFINKFLLSPEIKMIFETSSDYKIDRFVNAANMFKDMFYQHSKQYSGEFVEVSHIIRSLFEHVELLMDVFGS